MYKYVKRIFDIVFSLVGLILLSPIFLVVAIWIKLESAGPIVIKQQRYGKNKKPFACLKFRTMYEDTPPNSPTNDLKNAHKYITPSGRFLRRSGLDELLQLINVLRGEMSLIGPRPVILAEKNLIAKRDNYNANAVKPGIGGWAQSNGRDELDDETKARLDGEYVQNLGIRMDISCIWRTFIAVFTSDGFREGKIGDTPYKKEVQQNTKRITLKERASRKITKKREKSEIAEHA